MHPGKKLERAIKQSGLSKAAFARAMDADPQSVRNWINRGIPADKSFEAGRLLRKNPEWLCTDDPSVPETPEGAANVQLDVWRGLSPERRDLMQRLLLELSKP